MRARRLILLVVVAVIVACGSGIGPRRGDPWRAGEVPVVAPPPAGPSPLSLAHRKQPNLILIMTDDQAVGDMRALPLVKATLADRGVTFANSFASWPLCCPSRATTFTGQYAHNHKVLGNSPPAGSAQAFTTDSEALAVWLGRAGYATAHIGKYLNGYGNDERGAGYVPPGWNDWFGMVDPSTYQMWGYVINHNGAPRTYGKFEDEDPALYQTDVLRDIAIGEIDKFAAGSQPFFLSLAFLAPHEEIPEVGIARELPGPRPAPRHRGSFGKVPLPRPPSFDEDVIAARKPAVVLALAKLMSNETMERRVTRYRQRLESLRAVDEAVQAIVTRLAAQGLLDNTYLVFTSDNGFFNGEHHIPHGKHLMYEPSIRVPLVIRGPGLPMGQTSDELVANVDLAPTFVELAGAQPGRVMDGRSLIPYARDPSLRTLRPILLDAPVPQRLWWAPGAVVPAMHGLRTQTLSYIEYATGEVELYDMIADPDQLTSLHGLPEHAETEAQLRAVLKRYRHCAGDGCRANLVQTLKRVSRAATQPPTPPPRTRARRGRAR